MYEYTQTKVMLRVSPKASAGTSDLCVGPQPSSQKYDAVCATEA